MSSPTEWVALINDSTADVAARLSRLPAAPEAEELKLKAGDYLQQAQGWLRAPPTVEQRERLMKQVLALHVQVARLERQAAGA